MQKMQGAGPGQDLRLRRLRWRGWTKTTESSKRVHGGAPPKRSPAAFPQAAWAAGRPRWARGRRARILATGLSSPWPLRPPGENRTQQLPKPTTTQPRSHGVGPGPGWCYLVKGWKLRRLFFQGLLALKCDSPIKLTSPIGFLGCQQPKQPPIGPINSHRKFSGEKPLSVPSSQVPSIHNQHIDQAGEDCFCPFSFV